MGNSSASLNDQVDPELFLANEPCLDCSTAAVLMRVCRAAHAVASAAEAHFHISKEALYTLCVFFWPSRCLGHMSARGKVRGQVHAVASVDACFTACASATTTK